MPSPFPGMDPFIELEEWSNFHLDMIVSMQFQLAPQVLPKYIVLAERRVYLETLGGEATRVVPDLAVAVPPYAVATGVEVAADAMFEPKVFTAVLDDEQAEPYLNIVDRARNRIVTVIEFLSPTNKRRGLDGWTEYRRKRRGYLAGDVHLIEIDLLRGGERPPLTQPLASDTDFCVYVHRVNMRPKLHVYERSLRQPLPTIAVPLSAGDPDVTLNLQEVFTQVYDRVGYRYHLDYRRELSPPIRPADETWLRGVLGSLSTPPS